MENNRPWMLSPPLHGSPPPFEHYLHLLNGNGSPDIRSSIVSQVTVGHPTRPVPQKIPPPPPNPSYYSERRSQRCSRFKGYNCVPRETLESWDKLFEEGYKADVRIITAGGGIIAAHSNVLRQFPFSLAQTLFFHKYSILGYGHLKVPQVLFQNHRVCEHIAEKPLEPENGEASSSEYLNYRYIQEDMEKYALHLLVLAHAFSIPSLKRICTQCLEQGLLTTENVIDVLQLARLCDAPSLNLLCMRLIIKNLKAVTKSEGWRVMQRSNPMLGQELLHSVAEVESEKEQRLRKIKEKETYLQLHDAMEALLHICRDGCRTIGPHDKDLDGNQDPCKFPTCKGLELLVRHFAACKMRVPGGCGHCKRMWQLLELHSWMCNESETCKVPLCRHFKEKIQQQSKKNEMKWKLLVSKIMAAKRGLLPVSSLYSKSLAF